MAWIVGVAAVGVACILTSIELMLRYAALAPGWFRSRYSLIFVLANGLSTLIFILFLFAAGLSPEESGLASLIAVAVSNSAGLAVLRAGTFLGPHRVGLNTEQVRDELETYERSVGATIKALLTFLITQADEDLLEQHRERVDSESDRLLNGCGLEYDEVTAGLVDACITANQLPDSQSERIREIAEDVASTGYVGRNQAYLLIGRIFEVVGSKPVERALRFLRGDH